MGDLFSCDLLFLIDFEFDRFFLCFYLFTVPLVFLFGLLLFTLFPDFDLLFAYFMIYLLSGESDMFAFLVIFLF